MTEILITALIITAAVLLSLFVVATILWVVASRASEYWKEMWEHADSDARRWSDDYGKLQSKRDDLQRRLAVYESSDATKKLRDLENFRYVVSCALDETAWLDRVENDNVGEQEAE